MHGFAQKPPEQMRRRHAMPAIAMAEQHIGRQPPDMRHPRHGQREVAAPGEIDGDAPQARERPFQMRADLALDAARIGAAIDHAAAEQQPVVRRAPIVVEDIVAVLDTMIPWQQGIEHSGVERRGGQHLARHRHDLVGEIGHRIAEIGVAADQHRSGADQSGGGTHHDLGAQVLDAGDGAAVMDGGAEALGRRRFAQHQVERMDMAAAMIDHPAGIDAGAYDGRDASAVDHLELGMAVAFPNRLLVLQLPHLARGEGSEKAALDQIAGDAVFRRALADDVAAFEGHVGQRARRTAAIAAFDDREVAAIAVDDLPAVAARGAPADALALQHDRPDAGLGQGQGGGDARKAGADDADIGARLACQGRAVGRRIGRRGVVGAGMCVRSAVSRYVDVHDQAVLR